MREALFRHEALAAQQDKLYGRALLARTPSTVFLTIVAALVAAAVASYLAMGHYARKEHVVGYLAPTQGLIKVFTPQAGTIMERPVAEGQVVKQGDILLVISSERSTGATHEAQATMLAELRERRDSLRREKGKQAEIDALVAAGVADRIHGIEAELSQVRVQLELQRSRVASAERTVKRHEELATARFVSDAALQQKQEELLERRSQLAGLQRAMAGLNRDLNATHLELASSVPKRANSSSAIQRQISELEQQLTEMDTRRSVVLTAPAGGTVTTILAEVGQVANPGSLLLSVLPAGAELEAQLLVPTRAAGFIKVGQTVALRYQAFPYQRFGHYLGQVAEVGRSVIQPNESTLPLPLQEPVYRVTVRLPSQQVLAYGHVMPLQAGMALDADIWVDRRRLYEWLLDPILSVVGRV